MAEIESHIYFPPTSIDKWREKVIRELKIQDPDELIWMTEEGFPLQPLYHLPDYLKNHSLSDQQTLLEHSAYTIWEPLQIESPEILAKQLQTIQPLGIQHVFVDLTSSIQGNRWEILERTLPSSHLEVAVQLPAQHTDIPLSFPGPPHSSIGLHPVVFPWDFPVPYDSLHWDIRGIYEGGGSLTLQMAACLSAFAQDLRLGLDPSRVQAIHLSVGTQFYLEIAKFRVLPSLIQLVYQLFQKGDLSIPKIIAHTAQRDLGQNDKAINAIRSTLAALAASLGGCQGICISPISAPPNHFDLRLARNIHFLLTEEGKIQKVHDPLAGSYFIEEASDQIGKKAWEIFLRIEDAGGLNKAWEQGLITQWMEEGALKERTALESLSKIKIAENSYLNEKH
ncbi:MAG: methylmalonyl-CoA mutase family protein [Bacteroidota bacterium]